MSAVSTPPTFSALDDALAGLDVDHHRLRVERVAVAGDDLVEALAVAADQQLGRQRLADLGDRRGALRLQAALERPRQRRIWSSRSSRSSAR